MRINRSVLFLLICVAAACSGSPPEPVDATITDPIEDGDARDVSEVVVSGDGEALTFSVTVAESPVADQSVSEYAIANVFIDVDNDAATGKAGYGWDEGGFEFNGTLWVCEEGGDYCPGEGDRSGRGLATVSLSNLQNFSAGIQHFPTDEVSGKQFVARIPYDALGVEPGQTIRVWIVESLKATAQPEDRSGEAQVTLG